MKIKLNNIFFLACVLVAGLFQACKKNDYVIKSDKDLAYVALSKGGFSETEMFEKTTLQNLDLNVAVTTRSGLKKELHATVDVDPAVLAEYNQKFGKNYQILPASVYKVTSTSVTIPTGTNTIQVPIQVNTSLLDDTKDFVLPVKIKSADGLPISKNFGWVLLKIKKFKYEGKYEANGTVERQGNPIDDIKNEEKEIVNDAGVLKTRASYFGNNNINLDFKVNDDFTVTILPTSGSGISVSLTADGNCYFDPKRKAIIMRYKYTNASGAFRKFVEVWEKK